MASRQSVEAENFCGICKSAYTSPRILNCFHVFCTPCLEKLIENTQTFRCPLCRKDLPVPIEGIEKFPLCPFMEICNEEKTSDCEITCEMCDEIVVHSKCVDCDQNMCRICHEYHLRNNTFRKHKLIEKMNPEIPVEQYTGTQDNEQCSEHGKEFSIYCKSCNLPICDECTQSKHACHKIKDLEYTVKNMISSLDMLVINLQSKIPFMDNIIQNAKEEEKKYCTHIKQTKTELKSVASNLKDMMCKSIDMMLSESIYDLESFSKADKKIIQTFIEDSELNRIAMIKLLKTIEGTIRCGVASKIVGYSGALGRQSIMYDEHLFQFEMKLSIPKFHAGTFSHHQMKDFFGKIKREKSTKVLTKTQLPSFQIPVFGNILKMTKVTNFQSESDMRSIMSIGDSHVYVTHLKYIRRLIQNGGPYYNARVIKFDLNGQQKEESNTLHAEGTRFTIIGMNTKGLFVWCDNNIKSVPMENGDIIGAPINPWENDVADHCQNRIACFMDNGNMFIICDSRFFEVNETGKTIRTFISADISKKGSSYRANFVLFSKAKVFLIAYSKEIYTISLTGDLKHLHRNENSDFVAMCEDRHENVFVADKKNNSVALFTSDGHYVRDILTSKEEIDGPKSLTIDGRGNLWVLMNEDKITVNSYL
ncbi:uncharacterized protein LOC127723583 [Mytilus californianus]|uniref:uncharacterized protein LOC127723583 n=1 Tax=Mytilus californianus TaxID=6549 RepID=UPI002246B2C4|nr:uncharacterized protein LOC127723583 [Mytilus californianus]